MDQIHGQLAQESDGHNDHVPTSPAKLDGDGAPVDGDGPEQESPLASPSDGKAGDGAPVDGNLDEQEAALEALLLDPASPADGQVDDAAPAPAPLPGPLLEPSLEGLSGERLERAKAKILIRQHRYGIQIFGSCSRRNVNT